MSNVLRLLVVDPQPEFSKLVKEYLEVAGLEWCIECRLASTVEEAQDEVSTWQPGVVLVDAHLQGSESSNFVQWCRSEHTEVVLLSDQPSREIEESAKRRGASYLTKTENFDEMELVINKLTFLAPIHRNSFPQIH